MNLDCKYVFLSNFMAPITPFARLSFFYHIILWHYKLRHV